MDQKLLRCNYHKESMKLAMLSHERIFREQVYELHRLYRVQKILMNNVNMETRSNSDGSQGITIIGSTVEMRGEQVIDESEIQLTLGPSIYKRSSSEQRLDRSTSTGSSQNGEDKLGKHTSPWLFHTLSLNLTN